VEKNRELRLAGDADGLRELLVQNGIITQEQADNMSDDEIFNQSEDFDDVALSAMDQIVKDLVEASKHFQSGELTDEQKDELLEILKKAEINDVEIKEALFIAGDKIDSKNLYDEAAAKTLNSLEKNSENELQNVFNEAADPEVNDKQSAPGFEADAPATPPPAFGM
jgi:uncharacterized protein YabN with tetrapyrrole methylase and pyrophosphatase domain